MKKFDFKNCVLNNEERKYFALDPVKDSYEFVEIKEGYGVYFEGDTIKKKIEYTFEENNALPTTYSEKDTEIKTRDRSVVLPKTEKGKEKKLNYTSVSSASSGVGFFFTQKNGEWNIYVYNPKNYKRMPSIYSDEKIYTLEDFKKWLKNYIVTAPADYLERMEELKTAKHKTVKYYNGDIFRFCIDREYYGFGIIIAQILKLRKDKLLISEHVLNNTLTVPLIVRLYSFKTKNKDISVEEIVKHNLLKATIIADNGVIWGEYEIVGSKSLEENDIDFPIHAGVSLGQKKYYRFCWGIGGEYFNKLDAKIEELEDNTLLNHGVNFGVNNLEKINNSQNKNTEITVLEKMKTDFPLITNIEIFKNVLNAFNISENITFDEFNKKYGGKTIKEYIEYSKKYERTFEKSKQVKSKKK